MNKKNTYFEGFYLKHQNETMSIAFIPSLHKGEKKAYAMIQVISDHFTKEFHFDLCEASIVDTTFMIAHNVFSREGLYVDLHTDTTTIKGRLFYEDVVYPQKDIMGIFKYLPKMECTHGVISVFHRVRGSLMIDGKEVNFNDGYGYIEKDSGISFPKRYLWTQCLFQNGSIMIAVANIPYLCMHFNGCLSIILYQGRQYQLATYFGAKIISFKKDEVILKQGKYMLKARLIKYDEQKLKAPQHGEMQREIMESIASHVYYEFSKNDRVLFSIVSNRGSFEYYNSEKKL